MATEVLDIVVRQRGARVVARDIAKIGIAADTSARSLRTLQAGLRSANTSLQKVQANTTGAATSMKAFGGATLGAKRSLTALGTGVALVGGAISAALIRPLAGAIRAAGDFQQAMNLTGVLLNVERTSDAFAQLEARAKELGITTQFTATQAAEGLTFLAKAGFDANEALAAIGPTTSLAAAANIDLGRAADISTNILRGFRQTVDQLPASIDILASAFASSNTNIEELSRAFEAAGPVAVEFGQSFEDVASVISALADAGIKGQKAGIALRRIFINLEKDAAKLSPVLSQANVSIREVGADGVERLRPLGDIFKDIAASSLDTSSKIDLFGARALAAAGIIEFSAEGLEEFANRISNDVGRAAEVGAARLLGFNGAAVRLSSALEGLGIAIAEAGLLTFVQRLTEGVTAVTRAFAQLPRPIRTFIGFTAGAAAIVALLTLKIGLLIIAISILSGSGGFLGLIGVLAKVGTALRAVSLFFVTNPIGLFITALGLLGIALFRVRNDLVDFGDAQFRVRDILQTTSDNIVASFGRAQKAAEDFKKAGVEAVEALEEAEEKSTFGDAFTGILFQFQLAFGVLVRVISAAFEALKDTLRIPRFLELVNQGEFVQAAGALAGATAGSFFENFKNRLDAQGGIGGILEGEFEESVNAILAADTKLQEELERNRKKNAPDRPIPGAPPSTDTGTVLPVPISPGEIKRRQTALNALTVSIRTSTEVERKLFDVETVLNDARRVGKGLIDEQTEAFIRQRAATQIFEDIERSIDPVNESLFEQERALRDVAAAAEAAGISGERLARVQELVARKFRDARVELREFQEGLGTGEAITLGLTKGFEDFTDSLGNLFSNTREIVSSTLEGLLGEINNFVTTGEADFAGFARTVIAEIQKIIIKMIALQGIRAFEKTLEEGSGLAGFAKNLFGERLRAPGTPPTTLQQPGVPGAAPAGPGGFQIQSPFVTGAAGQIATAAQTTASDQLKISNPANDPVQASLTIDSPGVVTLRDTLGMKLDQSKTATVEQLIQLNAGIKLQNEQMAAAQAAGAGGAGSITSSLDAVSEVTGQGLVENKTEVAKQGGIVDKTNQQGFATNVGTALAVGNNIVRALQTGESADQGAAIGSLLGAIAGFAIGGPAGAVIGAQIGGQAGSIVGGLQEGGAIGPGQVGKPFLVGERGPELFTPPTTGMVIPNDMLGTLGGTPELNVQVINVDDAKSIPEAITTREGEIAILNVITRNKGRLKEILS